MGGNEERKCHENPGSYFVYGCEWLTLHGLVLGSLGGYTLGFIIGLPLKGKTVQLNINGNLDYYKSHKTNLEKYRYKWELNKNP